MFNTIRPILLVLFFAALIVFVNSYPNVSSIEENTKDYRQQVKNKQNLNDTEAKTIVIKPPEAPSLPNTITPVISPEKVNEIANPQPSTKPPKTTPGNDTNETVSETVPETKEPPIEIKLLTGFINVAPLILIAALGGFGIYLLFKYKKHFTLRSMFSTAIALVAICAIFFFGAVSVNFTEFLYDISLNFNLMFIIIFPIALTLGIWISYCVISKNTTVFKRNMGLAFSGALMGSFLAAFLPFWIVFILLIAIALFDIYSVKYGPIKKILDLEEQNQKRQKRNEPRKEKQKQKIVIYRTLNNTHERTDLTGKPNHYMTDKTHETQTNDTILTETDTQPLTNSTIKTQNPSKIQLAKPTPGKTGGKLTKPGTEDEFDLMLMYDNPDWSLGLGDFVIYSMFTSAVLTYFLLYLPYYIFYSPVLGLVLPWILFGICTLGLLFGFFITLRLLKKRDYLPGLPITIGCGFIVFILCVIILQLVNYVLYNEFAIII